MGHWKTGTRLGLATVVTALLVGCGHAPAAPGSADQSEERRLAVANGWLLGTSLGLGPALPMVFIHGVGGNHHLFNPQLAELRSSRRVVAFDQRGCGGSADAPGGNYDLETRVRDLGFVLDVIGLERVLLVGHGTGAQVVARYAERNPDRVKGLVLINPVSGNADAARIANLPDPEFRAAVERWLGTLLDGARPETREMVLDSVQVARVPAMRTMLADAAGNDLPGSLAAYPGPVLILAAPDEPVPGPLRPGIEVRRLPGGSHWSPLDTPAEVNAQIREFSRPLDAASQGLRLRQMARPAGGAFGTWGMILSVSLAAAPGEPGPGATLQVANRKVFTFRATLAGSSPAERVATAQARLDQLPVRGPMDAVETRPLQLGSERGTAVVVGSRLIFTISEGDIDLQAGETTEGLARQAAQVLTEALAAEREQRSVRLLVRSLLLAFMATVIAAGVLWLFVRARRAADLAVARTGRHEVFRIRGVDFGPIIRSTFRTLVFLLFWTLVLSVVEIWLTYVLSLFPLTRPWSDALLGSVLGLLARLGRALLAGIPDLLTAVVILLIGRAVAGFVSNVIHRVEDGTAALPWVHPETAGATRRLLVGAVWLITIAAAYPYLPGSGSDAFKALSLVVGLGLSLGSTGIVAQAMSGLVVIYSRALSRGDCVRIGDVEGVVTEVQLLSTRLLTVQGEEVTIPNTVVVNGAVKNFGRASRGQGALVSARVSIGYDTPWRKVHALLLDAARETPGLRADPAPYVLQRALDDFYVQYELFSVVEKPIDRPLVASALHARIQDGFNAAGLQIMSPHYVFQPRQPVLGEAPPAAPESAVRADRPAASGGNGR